MNQKEALSSFIMEEIIDDDTSIYDNQQLLEAGIIDSFGIIKLISFIEERFQIKLDNDDLIPQNFSSILTISEMISNKRKGLKN